jgi:hypothetical protein
VKSSTMPVLPLLRLLPNIEQLKVVVDNAKTHSGKTRPVLTVLSYRKYQKLMFGHKPPHKPFKKFSFTSSPLSRWQSSPVKNTATACTLTATAKRTCPTKTPRMPLRRGSLELADHHNGNFHEKRSTQDLISEAISDFKLELYSDSENEGNDFAEGYSLVSEEYVRWAPMTT